jgi:hypothetical protein
MQTMAESSLQVGQLMHGFCTASGWVNCGRTQRRHLCPSGVVLVKRKLQIECIRAPTAATVVAVRRQTLCLVAVTSGIEPNILARAAPHALFVSLVCSLIVRNVLALIC